MNGFSHHIREWGSGISVNYLKFLNATFPVCSLKEEKYTNYCAYLV